MKRLFSVLILSIIFLQTLVPFASAQTITSTVATTSAPLSTRLEEDVPRTYSTHTQMLILEVLAAASCQLSGIDPISQGGKCLGVDPKTNQIGFVENGGGAIAVLTSLMIFTFDIPVNTSSYVRYAVSDFGIAKSSYAQSAGFDSLSPLLPVWVAFRNVIYVIFVIVFMLIGMGIMFRRNIDSKTVITVQSAIPRIIIVLVLITFSFAIGGLLVDMMYLVMYISYGIVSSINGVNIPGLSPTGLVGTTPFGAAGGYLGIPEIAGNASRGFGSQLSAMLDGGIGKTIGTVLAAVIGLPLMILGGPLTWIGGGITLLGGGASIGGLGNEMVGAVGGIIAFLIIIIAIVSALFRLWITLLKSYLFILIDIAFAPIWIAGSLIPGSPFTAGTWFRHIMKHIIVFPLTFFIFLLGTAIVQVFDSIDANATVFAPPFIGNALNAKHLGSLIGLAIILIVPEVSNIAQSLIKAPEGKLLSAITPALGIGTGLVKAPVSAVGNQTRVQVSKNIDERIRKINTRGENDPPLTRREKIRSFMWTTARDSIYKKKKSH